MAAMDASLTVHPAEKICPNQAERAGGTHKMYSKITPTSINIFSEVCEDLDLMIALENGGFVSFKM